ncbi:hypothetical protein T05_3110, partial [Trichinella murrelli]
LLILRLLTQELTFSDHLQNRTTPSLNETVYLSAVKENAIPDNAQYNTSVLDKQNEASKKMSKIPVIGFNLYGNMGNSSIPPMNSITEIIMKPLLSLDNRNETDNSRGMMTPNIFLKRTFKASNERIVTSPSATEDSAAKVNEIPDNVQYNTSVLDKQNEASKKMSKIPVIGFNLYGNMGNSSVPPMNSITEIIMKPLLSLDNRNETVNSSGMMIPNIVLKRTFKASNERIVTSPSATEDSAAKVNEIPDNVQYNTSVLDKQNEASKKMSKIPDIGFNLYGNMGNSSIPPINSITEIIMKPLLSLDNRNETVNSSGMMIPNIVLRRSFKTSNERIVTSPSATEDSAAKVNEIPDNVQYNTSVLDKQKESLKKMSKIP